MTLGERLALLRAAAQGEDLHRLMPGLPAYAAAIVRRHAPKEIEATLAALAASPGPGAGAP